MLVRSRQGLIHLAFLVTAVVLSGCGKKSDNSSTTNGSVELNAADVRTRQPDVVAEPGAWYKEFKADGKNLEKYRGKVVEVSGKLKHLQADFLDDKFLYTAIFLVNDREHKNAAVGCHLDDKSEWSKLGIGQEVTVKGEYDPESPARYQMPFLKTAVVTKAGPENQLHYESEKLAWEYAADPKKTVEKCQDRTLIVTGEIVSIGEEGVITPCVDLKGKNDKVVRLLFEKRTFEKFNVKKGDRVTVLAVCDPLDIQRDTRIGLSEPYFLN